MKGYNLYLINDAITTMVLCGMSFQSDFAIELINIFGISFFWRFIFMYLFIRNIKNKQIKEQKK